MAWGSQWQEDEELRIASDGGSYTEKDFLRFYGKDKGARLWNSAQIVPNEPDEPEEPEEPEEPPDLQSDFDEYIELSQLWDESLTATGMEDVSRALTQGSVLILFMLDRCGKDAETQLRFVKRAGGRGYIVRDETSSVYNALVEVGNAGAVLRAAAGQFKKRRRNKSSGVSPALSGIELTMEQLLADAKPKAKAKPKAVLPQPLKGGSDLMSVAKPKGPPQRVPPRTPGWSSDTLMASTAKSAPGVASQLLMSSSAKAAPKGAPPKTSQPKQGGNQIDDFEALFAMHEADFQSPHDAPQDGTLAKESQNAAMDSSAGGKDSWNDKGSSHVDKGSWNGGKDSWYSDKDSWYSDKAETEAPSNSWGNDSVQNILAAARPKAAPRPPPAGSPSGATPEAAGDAAADQNYVSEEALKAHEETMKEVDFERIAQESKEERNKVNIVRELKKSLKHLGTKEALEEKRSIPKFAKVVNERYFKELGAKQTFEVFAAVFRKVRFAAHRKVLIFVVHDLLTNKRRFNGEADLLAVLEYKSCLVGDFLLGISGTVSKLPPQEHTTYERILELWKNPEAFSKKDLELVGQAWSRQD